MTIRGYCRDCRYLATLWFEGNKDTDKYCCTLFARDKGQPMVMVLDGNPNGNGSTCECFEEKMR